jgi:hypothetical protein
MCKAIILQGFLGWRRFSSVFRAIRRKPVLARENNAHFPPFHDPSTAVLGHSNLRQFVSVFL